MMTAIQYLRSLHEVCHFQTNGRGTGPASNSELGRWLNEKAVRINGKPIAAMDPVPYPIVSVVLFPKADRRCTLL